MNDNSTHQNTSSSSATTTTTTNAANSTSTKSLLIPADTTDILVVDGSHVGHSSSSSFSSSVGPKRHCLSNEIIDVNNESISYAGNDAPIKKIKQVESVSDMKTNGERNGKHKEENNTQHDTNDLKEILGEDPQNEEKSNLAQIEQESKLPTISNSNGSFQSKDDVEAQNQSLQQQQEQQEQHELHHNQPQQQALKPQLSKIPTPSKTQKTSKQSNTKKKKHKNKKQSSSIKNKGRAFRVSRATISADASNQIFSNQHYTNAKNSIQVNGETQDEMCESSMLELAHNEYETTLKRRIQFTTFTNRALPPTNTTTNITTSTTSSSSSSSSSSSPCHSSIQMIDMDQDMSLGMQLTILSGRVIVQSLNSLQDGRASPAQLSGKIQRGDILVRINSKSLRTLSGTDLMQELQVLGSSLSVIDGGMDEVEEEEKENLEYYGEEEEKKNKEEAFLIQQQQLQEEKYGGYGGYGNGSVGGKSQYITQNNNRAQWNHLNKKLTLRFVIGEGLILLQDEENLSIGGVGVGISGTNGSFPKNGQQLRNTLIQKYQSMQKEDLLDTLSLFIPKDFQLVDQLTGMPYKFSDEANSLYATERRQIPQQGLGRIEARSPQQQQPSTPSSTTITTNTANNELLALPQQQQQQQQQQQSIDDDPSKQTLAIISENLASHKLTEKWTSNFFQMDPSRSILLRTVPIDMNHKIQKDKEIESMQQLLEFGKKVMKKAGNLVDTLLETEEKIYYNHSKLDTRSYLPSMASVEEGHSDVDSDEHSVQEDDDTVESLLMTDAWKERIMFQLQKATQSPNHEKNGTNLDDMVSRNQNNSVAANVSQSHRNEGAERNDDESIALESFLFGGIEQTKALTSESKALPPLPITSSLLDLVTSLERSVGAMTILSSSTRRSSSRNSSRMECMVADDSSRSSMVERPIISVVRKDRVKADKVYFLFQEALPLWLTTFCPLNVDKRRILWPRNQSTNNDSFMDQDDDISDMSMGGVSTLMTSGGKAKQWREIIEENKLNPASRIQTCRLLTFYFTQKILMNKRTEMKERMKFVKTYGAYLNLYQCLVTAANLFMEEVIDELMEVAQHDLHHNDTMSTLSRKGALILYEPVMLSALLESLKFSVLDDNAIPLLVSAYPDLKPWQVRKYCTASCAIKSSSYYYDYMCLLLDPNDGHSKARKDKQLVIEWCEWSLSESFISNSKANFYAVASCKDKWLYNRDLPKLLHMGMSLSDYSLAILLINEMIVHPTYANDLDILSVVLSDLRMIGTAVIQQEFDSTNEINLGKILQIFQKLSTSKSQFVRQSINVPDEIYLILKSYFEEESHQNQIITEIKFINYLTRHSNPGEFLEALEKLVTNTNSDSSTFNVAILQELLKRAAKDNYNNKLSGAMLRVQRARNEQRKILLKREADKSTEDSGARDEMEASNEKPIKSNESIEELNTFTNGILTNGVSIWGKLLNGECYIDK